MDTTSQISTPSSRWPLRPRRLWRGLVARLVLMTLASPAMAVPPDIGLFFQAGSRDEGESRNALAALARDWDNAFPGTTVLSLETGFDRDYSEGAAYRGYFATDRLMFDIPAEDNRLKNKAEVLTLLLSPQGGDSAALKTLAISADFLMKNRLYQTAFAGRNLVVVTSRTGANRVYDAPAGLRFAKLRENDNVEDATGRAWEATEEALVPGDGSAPAPRLAARRAFWFGWHAQFPDTELIK